MKEKLLKLLCDIHKMLENPTPECRLPQDSCAENALLALENILRG